MKWVSEHLCFFRLSWDDDDKAKNNKLNKKIKITNRFGERWEVGQDYEIVRCVWIGAQRSGFLARNNENESERKQLMLVFISPYFSALVELGWLGWSLVSYRIQVSTTRPLHSTNTRRPPTNNQRKKRASFMQVLLANQEAAGGYLFSSSFFLSFFDYSLD